MFDRDPSAMTASSGGNMEWRREPAKTQCGSEGLRAAALGHLRLRYDVRIVPLFQKRFLPLALGGQRLRGNLEVLSSMLGVTLILLSTFKTNNLNLNLLTSLLSRVVFSVHLESSHRNLVWMIQCCEHTSVLISVTTLNFWTCNILV